MFFPAAASGHRIQSQAVSRCCIAVYCSVALHRVLNFSAVLPYVVITIIILPPKVAIIANCNSLVVLTQ